MFHRLGAVWNEDGGIAFSIRIAIWFIAWALSVAAFSSLPGLVQGAGSFSSFLFIAKFTVIFSFAVWLLYLPFVITLKNSEDSRKWSILAGGTFVGPTLSVAFGIISQILGGNSLRILYGDGIGLRIFQSLPFEIAIGFLTTMLYIIGLKLMNRLQTSSPTASPRGLQ